MIPLPVALCAVLARGCQGARRAMGYGDMPTPGVVIDGKVVHAGGVPTRDKIAGWLAGAAGEPAAAQGGCCSGGKCC